MSKYRPRYRPTEADLLRSRATDATQHPDVVRLAAPIRADASPQTLSEVGGQIAGAWIASPATAMNDEPFVTQPLHLNLTVDPLLYSRYRICRRLECGRHEVPDVRAPARTLLRPEHTEGGAPRAHGVELHLTALGPVLAHATISGTAGLRRGCLNSHTSSLAFLCAHHHHNFLTRGWAVRLNDDGLPEWIPPYWIDRDQKPLINTRIQAALLARAQRNRPSST